MNTTKDPAALQPQFQNAIDFSLQTSFGRQKQMSFVELKERSDTDRDEVDEERQLVLRCATTSITRSIEVGNTGAFVLSKTVEKKNNHAVWLNSLGCP